MYVKCLFLSFFNMHIKNKPGLKRTILIFKLKSTKHVFFRLRTFCILFSVVKTTPLFLLQTLILSFFLRLPLQIYRNTFIVYCCILVRNIDLEALETGLIYMKVFNHFFQSKKPPQFSFYRSPICCLF